MNFTTNPVYKFILGTMEFGLEHTAKRWYSIYQGKVAKSVGVNKVPGNVDERNQGRVFVNVHDLGIGEKDKSGTKFISADLLQSALPISPYAGSDHGFYFPPEVGDSVWVSFEYGNNHQPRYLGGWWGNPQPGASAQATTELPFEFHSTPGVPPTKRGIKTGYGHGLVFSDAAATPYVLLWSGKSNGQGVAAAKNQQLILTDDPSNAGIGLLSFYGHFMRMNDTTRSLTISGRPDRTGLIANSFVIDDILNTVTIKTRVPGQSVMIDGTTQAITVTSPGAVLIGALGGVAIGSGVTPPAIPTPGTFVEEGAGAKISAFAGNVTEIVSGLFTQNVGGVFAQNVVGIMNVSAAALNLTAALLNLTGNIVVTGTAQFGSSTPQRLVHQQIIDLLVNHSHPTAAPGPPSMSPSLAVLGTSAAPASTYVTTDLKAS